MSSGPPTAVKPLTHAIAGLLASESGARALINVQLAGMRGQKLLQGLGLKVFRKRAPAKPASGEARRIGIWEARDGAGGREWVRVQNAVIRDWADVERIGPKRGRRVVLLGESVARGMFYDPEHNVALALQRALDATGVGPIEVVDLACNDQRLIPLQKLADDAMALEPDALVFFAGNNWYPRELLDRGDHADFARGVRGGIQGVRGLVERRLEEGVSHFVRHVAKLGKARGAAVLLLVPEFNLLDWRNDRGKQAPWLPEGRNQRWMSLRVEAEAALAAGDLDKAEQAATRMLDLDEGVSAVSPTLLARVKLARGDAREARRLLEAARDAEIWTRTQQTPRCFGVTQRALREAAASHGVAIVDLPKVYSDHLGGALPDRRLFHDYCHLTAEGIAVTVRAAAAKLAPLLSVTMGPHAAPNPAAANGLAEVDLLPSKRVVAEANFTAAIHNANWGQPLEIVHRHCVQALEASPEVAESMERFLDFRIRRIPPVLSKSFALLEKEGSHGTARFLAGGLTPPKTFSSELTRAIMQNLEPVRPGVTERFGRVLVEEHAVEQGAVDLLDTFYACDCFAEMHREHKSAYYRAYEPRSRFFLVVGDPGRPVELDAVLRIPEAGAPAGVEVFANGVAVGSASVAGRWTRASIKVPAGALQKGANRIEIGWPEMLDDRNRLEQLADTLQEERAPDFTPAFGEIHSLTARVSAAG